MTATMLCDAQWETLMREQSHGVQWLYPIWHRPEEAGRKPAKRKARENQLAALDGRKLAACVIGMHGYWNSHRANGA